jgi:hypothetical protein
MVCQQWHTIFFFAIFGDCPHEQKAVPLHPIFGESIIYNLMRY